MLAGLGYALGAVMRLDHVVARRAQQIAQDLAVVLGVLDHEYLLAHWAASLTDWALTGIEIVKVEPLPTSDSTVMRPPCSSTMRREIERPSPVPPFLRVLVLSTCWNSSKILRLIGRRDAGAGIDDRHLEAVAGLDRTDLDAALVGELDGIADQVQQHLGQPPRIAGAGRQAGRHGGAELEVLGAGERFGGRQ